MKVKDITDGINAEVRKVIVEQDELLENSLVALLVGGHVLIEGVPGLAKTLLVRALARTMDIKFQRLQFTPDLMPSDVIGTKIFNMKTREFELKKGPIFTNFLLGDEINRTPPKTQAGLLEAMQDQTVTINGEEMALANPFMVFATQNPIEYEGTYPLPEALMDRFLMKIKVSYPSKKAEAKIVLNHHQGLKTVDLEKYGVMKVCNAEEILECQREVEKVDIDEELVNYIVEIICQTRNNPYIEIGSSPRGSVALLQTSKAHAAIKGRDYVIPEDIISVVVPTLGHRIKLRPEVEIEGTSVEQVISKLISQIKVPR